MLLQAPTRWLPTSHDCELAATTPRALDLDQIGTESLSLWRSYGPLNRMMAAGFYKLRIAPSATARDTSVPVPLCQRSQRSDRQNTVMKGELRLPCCDASRLGGRNGLLGRKGSARPSPQTPGAEPFLFRPRRLMSAASSARRDFESAAEVHYRLALARRATLIPRPAFRPHPRYFRCAFISVLPHHAR